MLKHKIFIVGLNIFGIALVIVGFVVAGTPVSQQDKNLDTMRLAHFSNLRLSVENYYQSYAKLPTEISELKQIDTFNKDPKTQKPYEYQVVSPTSYKFCTEFATDTNETPQPSYSYGENQNHKKGYDCITYTISSYLQQAPQTNYNQLPTATPTIDVVLPSQATKQTTSKCLEPYTKTAATSVTGKYLGYLVSPQGLQIYSDKQQAQYKILTSNSKFYNKYCEEIPYTTVTQDPTSLYLTTDNQLIILGKEDPTYTITATAIQNLSR